jgi:hypothetical protein
LSVAPSAHKSRLRAAFRIMRISPEIDIANVVFLGDFNPRIFRADWFGAQGLLTEEEVQAAETQILHPDLSKFSADWLLVHVERHRFIAETSDHPSIRVADFVVRTFGEFLSHTPVGRIGINRTVHFVVPDLETRDRIGERLAPQDAWGEWGPHIKGTKERHGGMHSLIMEQRDLDDREKGHIRAKVEPSEKLKHPYGVLVDINDDYQIGAPEEVTGCEEAVAIVRNNFERSMKRAAWIINQVMALGQE